MSARVGAAAFAARSSASYFAGSKYLGFVASREGDETRIEVSVEGIDAKGIGIFAAGPREPHEISLTIRDETQSTRSRGTGSIEITEFTLEIDRDLGIGEGRVRGAFEAQLDGLAISEGVFDVPVFSADICNQDVEARAAFDCS